MGEPSQFAKDATREISNTPFLISPSRPGMRRWVDIVQSAIDAAVAEKDRDVERLKQAASAHTEDSCPTCHYHRSFIGVCKCGRLSETAREKDKRIAELELHLRNLLKSSDCSWLNGDQGNDWKEAVIEAEAALGLKKGGMK